MEMAFNQRKSMSPHGTGPPRLGRPPRRAGAAGGFNGSQVTAAERKADLEAGVLSPGDAAAHADTGSDEFKDRLRSTLASFSRPRAEAPPPGGGPSDPPSDGEAK